MAMVDITRPSRWAAFLVLAALAGPLLRPAMAGDETAIRFTLDRRIDGPAAPFFLAIEKGYFQAEGLNVTIDAATGSPESLNRLATGGYHMGVADLNSLIQLRDGVPDTPIKAVFVIFDKPPSAIIARKSRGIATPKDLEGKRLAVPAADDTFAQWPVFAKVNGIDTDRVKMENVGLPVREPMLAAGEVDAIIGCSFGSYIDLKERGVPPGDLAVLAMADYGVDLYGDAIMVNTGFAAEKPQAVRSFLRAYLKALKDTVRDPARAVEAVLHRSDAAGRTVELERLRMAIGDNVITPAVKAAGYGGVEPERFGAAIDQLALTYRFRAREKATEAFDPSFLPPAAYRKVSETVSR
jgi:NitT/TauT family transport system substrate-binding protein